MYLANPLQLASPPQEDLPVLQALQALAAHLVSTLVVADHLALVVGRQMWKIHYSLLRISLEYCDDWRTGFEGINRPQFKWTMQESRWKLLACPRKGLLGTQIESLRYN